MKIIIVPVVHLKPSSPYAAASAVKTDEENEVTVDFDEIRREEETFQYLFNAHCHHHHHNNNQQNKNKNDLLKEGGSGDKTIPIEFCESLSDRMEHLRVAIGYEYGIQAALLSKSYATARLMMRDALKAADQGMMYQRRSTSNKFARMDGKCEYMILLLCLLYIYIYIYI